MHIDVATENGTIIVRPAGDRLDIEEAAEFRGMLLSLIEQGHRQLVVDLKDVTFIDSSGLGALVSALKTLKRSSSDGDVRLASVQPPVVITNAVKHGAREGSNSTITCEVELEQGSLTMRIIDDGSGFVVRKAALPDLSPVHIDALPASGYGLPIIHTVFPLVRVITVDGRFALELGLPARV